jgi:hypothetical protein
MRGGKALPIKAIVDEAIAMGGCDAVKSIVVYRRTGNAVNMQSGRDRWLHELVAPQADTCEPNGSARSIRCSSCTRPGRPASRRACSIRRAAICSGACSP